MALTEVTKHCGRGLLFGLLALQAACSGEPESSAEVGGVDRIVYAVRQHTVVDGAEVSINVAGGMGQVMDYKRYVPGGRLEVLDLRTGETQNLIAAHPLADIASIDVSFDKTKVLFSMKRDAEDSYHLYWASLEDTENPELHQLTFGPYDDLHGIWLPGDRIAFITDQAYTEMGTRADEYNHARIVTQIATITLTGGDADRKLCSQNLSHSINLFAMHDGRIGFSRWEHLENVNDVKLFAMNPDCTQMVAVAGQHGKPANSLVQISETNEANVFLGVATSRENTIQAGALMTIDARGAAGINEESASYDPLTPAVPRGEEPSPVGRYRSPVMLPDGTILTSWADGFVNELNELAATAPEYGIYVYDPQARRNKLIINHTGSWELYARPIVKRDEPPVISSIQDTVDASVPTRIGAVNVRQTSLFALHEERVSGAQFSDTPMDEALRQAVKVRIIEGFSSEAAPGRSMFGLTMAEGAALIGEAHVYEDGSFSADIPPYIPVHLQAVDEFELAIRNQTTWIQGMPGEDRTCGGCHEERTRGFLPSDQALSIAAGEGPENFMIPVAERIEYPWAYAKDAENPNQIQALLDAKCSSCHNETTNGSGSQQFYEISMNNSVTGESTTYQIPRLDLTSRPITVTYDRTTEAWPASYVSIFYPAALEMEMSMGAEIVGEIPPKWGIPSDARHSALIEKLNITSAFDETKYAWPLGEAFSDPRIAGGTRTDHAALAGLTREELTMLIRAIDMGGQFYSRQNSDFVPFASDPVVGGQEY